MGKISPWVTHRRNKAADDAAISEFLKNGGKVKKLKMDDGTYEKGAKKMEGRFPAGFNPFSKEDVLEDKE